MEVRDMLVTFQVLTWLFRHALNSKGCLKVSVKSTLLEYVFWLLYPVHH